MVQLVKTKAIFEMFLVVTAVFLVSSFDARGEESQDSIDNSNDVCCERTKSGDECVNTGRGNCNPNFRYSEKECSEAVFCETGCCINNDGTCGNAASKSSCDAKGGSFLAGDDCLNIPLCNKGCCNIGDNYFMATKKQCSERAVLFQNLKANFDSSVNDEFTCIRMSQEKEKGCCIQDDTCIYTSRDSCIGSDNTVSESYSGSDDASSEVSDTSGLLTESNAIFESGKYCSKFSICGCKTKDHKECFDGDVYWYDSCGNKEDKAQDCDFAKNTLCSSKTLKCESLNCKDTFDKKAIDGSDIASYDGVPRKNGESWCEYDGAVGFGQDLVGSRHYRDLCVNGEEFIEPCKDYREEYCIQANVKTPYGNMLEASCKSNKYSECTTTCNTAKDKKSKGQIKLAMQKDRECCENPKKGCFWSSASGDQIRKINADAQEDITSTCADAGDPNNPDATVNNAACTEQNYEAIEPGDGMCLPLVPPGLKFWPDEDEEAETETSTADAKKVCDVGSRKCEVYFYKNMMTGWKWKMKDPGKCMKKDFAVSSMAYCRSLGDCGAHYNVAGEFSNIAYECETSDGDCKGNMHGKNYDLLNIDWEQEIGGFNSYAKAKPLQLKDIDLGDYEGFNAIPIEVFVTFGVGYVAAATSLIINGILIDLLTGTILSTLVSPTALLTAGSAATSIATSTVGGIASTISALLGWLGFVGLIIAVLVTITSFIGAETDTLEVTVTCQPWQAPYGYENCEKCENEDMQKELNFNSCTEYKCKSLGQNCKWIPENEGSNRSSCVAVSINDVTTPQIRPWPEALTEDYKITEFTNGYEITPAVDGYGMITFGITTNEPSICKYSEEPGIKYDLMSLDFGDPFVEENHMMTLTAVPNEVNEVYIKCKDANGNANTIDYMVKFTAKAGIDLTPPIILESSIKDNAVLSSGSTPVEIFINEPATCRHSLKNVDYEIMENGMVCNADSSRVNMNSKFKCKGILNANESLNTYYFRCRDVKGNKNQESFALRLSGSGKLNIASAMPSGEIDYNNITLQVETEGGSNDGIAICKYSFNGISEEFENTDSNAHSSDLGQLSLGSYNIDVACQDNAGNEAGIVVSFKVTRDNTAPQLMFLYKEGSMLIVTMDEASLCEYSDKSFNFGTGSKMDGTDKQHTLNIDKVKYSVICADAVNNIGKEFIVHP